MRADEIRASLDVEENFIHGERGRQKLIVCVIDALTASESHPASLRSLNSQKGGAGHTAGRAYCASCSGDGAMKSPSSPEAKRSHRQRLDQFAQLVRRIFLW
jgi:hypothetical protein